MRIIITPTCIDLGSRGEETISVLGMTGELSPLVFTAKFVYSRQVDVHEKTEELAWFILSGVNLGQPDCRPVNKT